MAIEVGSIIYVINASAKSIVPAMVSEQIISKTVTGETVSHNVKLPNGKTTKLESLDVAFFSSLDEVRHYLFERAKEIIETGIKQAEAIAVKEFGDGREPSLSVDSNSTVDNPTEVSDLKVTLDTGEVVNVRVPPEFLD